MDFIPLEKLENKRPVVILLRHAERHPIVDWEKVDEPLLTETGQRDSFRLGEKLSPLSPLLLLHSPVPRCQQTAEGICQGITSKNAQSTVVGALEELAGQDILKENWHKIVLIIREHGWPYFCRKWFDGRLFGTLVMPLKQAAHFELKLLLQQLKGNQASTINVTHDFLISVLREYFFGIRFQDFGIPKPLDAIAAYLNDGNIHLLYHEHECVVELPLE